MLQRRVFGTDESNVSISAAVTPSDGFKLNITAGAFKEEKMACVKRSVHKKDFPLP